MLWLRRVLPFPEPSPSASSSPLSAKQTLLPALRPASQQHFHGLNLPSARHETKEAVSWTSTKSIISTSFFFAHLQLDASAGEVTVAPTLSFSEPISLLSLPPSKLIPHLTPDHKLRRLKWVLGRLLRLGHSSAPYEIHIAHTLLPFIIKVSFSNRGSGHVQVYGHGGGVLGNGGGHCATTEHWIGRQIPSST